MTSDLDERRKNLILGALVADAAAMGLHWIYDQAHIRAIAPEAPEFTAPTAQNYADVPGYFAHGGREVGQQSQYGAQLMVMLRALAAGGGAFEAEHFVSQFRAHFGYGGTFVGYIDHATRNSLDTYQRLQDSDEPVTRGAVDMQLPAIAKLPPLVAAVSAQESAQFTETITAAVRLTSDHPRAIDFGKVCAVMMQTALETGDIAASVAAGRSVADATSAALLADAVGMTDQDTNQATQHFGLACDLDFGVPSAVHNILTAPSFAEGVRRNIYAGGDSCGRSILVGAMLGACHGIGGDHGIPQDWLARIGHGEEVAATLAKF